MDVQLPRGERATTTVVLRLRFCSSDCITTMLVRSRPSVTTPPRVHLRQRPLGADASAATPYAYCAYAYCDCAYCDCDCAYYCTYYCASCDDDSYCDCTYLDCTYCDCTYCTYCDCT